MAKVHQAPGAMEYGVSRSLVWVIKTPYKNVCNSNKKLNFFFAVIVLMTLQNPMVQAM